MAAFSLAGRLRAGETAFSAWTTLASPLVVEAMAREGFAAVNLDGQHGMWDAPSLAAGIAAVHAGGAAQVVRVPL
jgi:4-hydroxy-2-oxoheptanedioate aldolase